MTAILMGGYAAALVTPRRADRWIVRRGGALSSRLKNRRVMRLAGAIDSAVGVVTPDESLRRARDHYLVRLENLLCRIRGLHRGGWRPETRIEGLEHLERALEDGKGAIVWRMQFCSPPLLKQALWERGFPLVHLSSLNHGADSRGWLARRVLQPMVRRSENWFLEERVTFEHRRSSGYVRRLIASLERNRVVLIFGDLWGLNPVVSPFLGGHASFATGAPSLAWKTGAELLTAFVSWEGACRYRVRIQPPIGAPRDVGRQDFVRTAVAEFTGRLEEAVAAEPASWMSWGSYLHGYGPFAHPGDG